MMELMARNVDELGDFWARQVYPFVKPIVAADEMGRALPIGTGILVSYREKQYLLTAHHVTKGALAPGEDGALYTFAPDQMEVMGINYSVDDPYDLSVTELPPPSRPCLQLPRQLASHIREGELCLVLGFPARSKSWEFDHAGRVLRPAPFAFIGTVTRISPGRFSVIFSRKHAHRNGRKLPRVGKLNGISGGGGFVLRDARPRLAGIVIDYPRGAEIGFTDSDVIWSMMRRLGGG
jgi:hypothetical protein